MLDLLRYYSSNIVRIAKSPNIVLKKPDPVQTNSIAHSEMPILVIKRNDPYAGLFSYIITAIGWIAYAEKKHYIPVIDMQNYPNPYLDDSLFGKVNPWEYYFEQPGNMTVEDAYQYDNVFISYPYPPFWPSDNIAFFKYRRLVMDRWKRYVQKYIHINSDVIELVDQTWKKKFRSAERVLGVKCRGTDYLAKKPEGHPVQPDIKTVMEKADEVCERYSIDKIFIATEDELIEQQFLARFKEKCIISDQIRRPYDGIHWITEMKSARENDAYLSGLEYLVTILMLARCDCFLSGMNSGAVGVFLFSNGFTYDYIWDLGRYPILHPTM